jgi:hypothetical protein
MTGSEWGIRNAEFGIPSKEYLLTRPAQRGVPPQFSLVQSEN